MKRNYILINNLSGGGAERQISYIAQLPEIEKILCIEPILQYDIPSEKIIFLTKRVSAGRVSKMIQIFNVLWQLKKLKINKETHLICFLQLSLILGIIAKYLFKCRTTLSIRINPFLHAENSSGYSLSGKLLQFLLSKADAIVPNSYDTANDLSKHYPQFANKIHTIVNGYDVSEIEVKKNQVQQQYASILSQHQCLLTSGRLETQKGQWYLLRIMSALKKENVSCKLLIMGEGEMLDELATLSENLKLSTYVFSRTDILSDEYDVYFIGFQKNPYYFYHQAKLFLFPSIYEGLPNALIENLICGTPAIVSNCKSGPYEIMMNENTYVETNTPVETKFGYLMPSFSGETLFTEVPLLPIEAHWKSCIQKIMIKGMNKIEKNTIQEKYAIEKMHHHWKTFLRQFMS